MRIPIILAIAVILFTPADIRDVTMNALGQLGSKVAELTVHKPAAIKVADSNTATTTTR